MRIALVSPYDVDYPSGVNVHIAQLAREFRARGHQVSSFAPGSSAHGPQGDVTVIGRPIAIPSGGSLARVTLSPLLGRKVGRALEEGQFDIVHIHEPLVPMLPVQFLRLSRTVNVGTFHASHDGGSRGYSLMRYLLRRWAKRLDGRIAVSPAAARLASRYFPGQYEVIPNGVDVAHFASPLPCPPDIGAFRPYILFVGRFEERKGLSVLLRAFATLKTRRPDVHLVIVGDGVRRARHEAWVNQQGLAGVHFAGYVSTEALPAYYQHAATFCAPNTGNESFGIVLLEAMAAGCPIVASNIEGFAELVAYGVQGLVVPPANPEALASALTRILSDPALGHALAAKGEGYVSQFSWPGVAESVLALYERLLAERRAPA